MEVEGARAEGMEAPSLRSRSVRSGEEPPREVAVVGVTAARADYSEGQPLSSGALTSGKRSGPRMVPRPTVTQSARMLERCRNDEASVGVDAGDPNIRSTA
jgi:hypothetical protein